MRRLFLALSALALVLAACGDDDDTTEAAPTEEVGDDATDADEAGDAGGATVVAEGFAFAPTTVELTSGGSVTWRNEDGVGHTVTAGTPGDPTGEFDEELPPGEEVEVAFDEPGTYPYFCRIHPTMTGEVVVA